MLLFLLSSLITHVLCAIFIAAFGQSSTSPFGQTSFGTPQGFGQSSTAANNPFCPKTVWQPNDNFWGTDWKLALCNYIHWCLWPAAIHSRIWHNIYWCLWPAAIHSHIWHPILLSVWELHTSLWCIPQSCLWCHILW